MQSRVKKLDKIEKRRAAEALVRRTFDFRAPPRSGDDVVKLESRAEGATAARGIHDGFDFTRAPQRALGVMGENGAGKSTLLEDDGRRAGARRRRGDDRAPA